MLWVYLVREWQNLGWWKLNIALKLILTREIKVLLLIKISRNFWSNSSQRRLLLCVIHLSSTSIILRDWSWIVIIWRQQFLDRYLHGLQTELHSLLEPNKSCDLRVAVLLQTAVSLDVRQLARLIQAALRPLSHYHILRPQLFLNEIEPSTVLVLPERISTSVLILP